MNLTVVIPVYRECRLERTVLRIKQTCKNLPELVIIFDGDNPKNYVIDYPEELLVVSHNKDRLGTGKSRHIGMELASNEVVFQTDGHIDFKESDWADIVIRESNAHPNDILCCMCQPMFYSNMTFIGQKEKVHRGSELVLRCKVGVRQLSLGKLWDDEQEFGEIPLVMGAGYTVRRSRYFDVLNAPWRMNSGWGNDEQTISLVNWVCGGESRLVDVTIGHQMDTASTRRKGDDMTTYMAANRLSLIRSLPMSDFKSRLLQWWIVDEPSISSRIHEVEEIVDDDIVSEMKEHLSTCARTFDDFIEKFDVKDIDRDDYGLKNKEVRFCNPSWDDDVETLFTDREVCIKSLPRSGSHMLPDWVINQTHGKVHWATGMNMMRHRSNDPKSFSKSNHFSLTSKRIALTSTPTVDNGKTMHIYTFEKMHPDAAKSIPWISAKDTKVIHLIRSPYNFLASFVHNTHPNISTQLIRNMWVEYARCWLEDNDEIKVFYDEFVSNKKYRDWVAREIGVDDRNDDSLQRVTNYGRGSSFDGVKFDGRASEMKVNDRWKVYDSEDWMNRLLADVEVRGLHDKIIASATKTLLREIEDELDKQNYKNVTFGD